MADFQSKAHYETGVAASQPAQPPHDPDGFWTSEERSYVFSRLNGLAAFYEQFVRSQHAVETDSSDVVETYGVHVPSYVEAEVPPKSEPIEFYQEPHPITAEVPVRLAQSVPLAQEATWMEQDTAPGPLPPVSLAYMPSVQSVARTNGQSVQTHVDQKKPTKRSARHSQKIAKNTKRTRARKRTARAFFVLAILINLVGLGFIIKASMHTKQILRETVAHADQAAVAPSATPADLPEETPPNEDAYANYVVAPDEPRYLQVPSLGLKARVFGLGQTSSGALDAPKNIFDTGWYKNSAKPGFGAGAVLIDGHSTGLSKEGVFTKLGSIAVGQKITLTRGDGKLLSYSVVKVQKLPNAQVDMSSLLLSADPKRQGLNLITCSGNFNQRDFTFSERTLVYALIDK